MKVSKELLSNILGDEYSERLVEIIKIEDNLLQTFYTCSSKEVATCLGIEINIYELAHKCKKWARDNGFYIMSYPIKSKYISKLNGGFTESWSSDTEPEAIFKACQWILDNKVES